MKSTFSAKHKYSNSDQSLFMRGAGWYRYI